MIFSLQPAEIVLKNCSLPPEICLLLTDESREVASQAFNSSPTLKDALKTSIKVQLVLKVSP